VDAIRIDLRAYTASFRVPGMMGYQVTSPVPPPATVYGLLAAASGREITPEETWIAYRFEYEALAQDLEKIVGFFEGGPKWDKKLNAVNTAPITRQFLYNPHLVLYLKPGRAAEAFRRPRFPLVLGRSQDVAYVDCHREVSLQTASSNAKISGVLLPFPTPRIQSRIMSFPTYFELATRRALAVKPFHVIDSGKADQTVQGTSQFYQEGTGEQLAVPLFDLERLMP
jgi:CRISPR-associated protein Cas5t